MLRAALATLLCAATLWVGAQAVDAQRDPTLPPAAPAPGAAAAAGVAPGLELLRETGGSLIFVDGQPRLVRGSRLLAPGARLGDSRLDQISETDIVLRQGRTELSVTRYPGVEVRVAKPEFLIQREAAECAAAHAAYQTQVQAAAAAAAAAAQARAEWVAQRARPAAQRADGAVRPRPPRAVRPSKPPKPPAPCPPTYQ